MTDSHWARLADLVPDALDLPPTARAAFLDDACRLPSGDVDLTLRAEAASLVDAAEAGTDALASPVAELVAEYTEPSPPETVGPWRVVGVLGEGGQGVVYRGRRADGAFERDVALKLLRPGVGGRVAARLAEERRVLARLEHEGIARLYDGGVDDDGRPYLAMELVEGAPLGEAARRLPVRDRVALLADVCDAVAYAHARLVVHRDLKPSNVLVTPGGRPKLLDFGVAKLLDPDPAERPGPAAEWTVAGWMTPAYAAPEQVAGGDVTTATDVYALGVLAYEALSGQRPYPTSGVSPVDVQRLVCETVPTPPSSVAAPDVARALRGDLDTVVMKALEKEPARRYASAEAFATDLRRHLTGLPVEARPATVSYRVGRFVRRHRAGVVGTAAALVAIVAVAAVAFARVSAERDRAATEAAKSEAVSDFLTSMLGASDPTEQGQGVRVADLLDHASADADSVLADQPEVEAAVRVALGRTYMELSRHADAERELRRAIGLFDRTVGPVDAGAIDARGTLGEAFLAAARYAEADSVLADALRGERALGRGETKTLADLLANRGVVRYYMGDLDGMIDAQREAVRILKGLPDTDPLDLAAAQGNIATALMDLDRFDEAIPLFRERLALYRRELPPGNLKIARALNGLASGLYQAGRTAEALPVQREAVETMRTAIAGNTEQPVELVRLLANHTAMLLSAGRLAGAERVQAEAEAIVADAFPEPGAIPARVLASRASLLDRSGQPLDAARLAARAAAMVVADSGPRTRSVADYRLVQGEALLHAGRRADAAGPLREARSIYAEIYSADHAETLRADSLLALVRRR